MKAGSAIVMTGSVTGIEGSKYLLDYSMTKGGIHALHPLALGAPSRQRYSRQRGRPRPGLDPAQSRRQATRAGCQVVDTAGEPSLI
jgi:hypothetical protein